MSSARITISPGCMADVMQVADALREIDRHELELTGAYTGRSPVESVVHGWRISTYKRVFMADGEPIVVYGVAPSPFEDGDGCPWMVATNAITRVPRSFLKASRSEIEAMRAGWRELRNATHKDNVISLQWLQWLGFRVSDEPVGPGGVMRMFSMPGLPAKE